MKQPTRRSAHAPIGIFDSGMGGLSVAQDIQRLLPAEALLYLADTQHVPYGCRSDEDIRALTAHAVDWLYQHGCKLVVVACNTASAFSLTPLRNHYRDALPIVGLVPAVKPAVLATQTGTVGVLATNGTLRGTLLHDVIREVASPAGVSVMTAVSPDLVPFVEAGLHHSAACRAELLRVLTPLAEAGVDQLVLGCTHYPFLAEPIRQLFGTQFTLVDSGAAVARQTQRLLEQRQLLNHSGLAAPPLHCAVTGSVAQAQPVLAQLVNFPFVLQQAYDTIVPMQGVDSA